MNNEMQNNEKDRKNILIIVMICIIVIITISIIIIEVNINNAKSNLNNKNNNTITEENSNNNNETKDEDSNIENDNITTEENSNTKYENLLVIPFPWDPGEEPDPDNDKYVNLYNYLDISPFEYDICDPFETGYTQECKNFLAFNLIDTSELISVNLENCGDLYHCTGHDFATTAFSYDTLNNKYKQLFGSSENIKKQDYTFGLIKLNFDSMNNLFYVLAGDGGGGFLPYYSYEIKNKYFEGENYIIEILCTWVEGDFDEYSTVLEDGTKIYFTAEDDIFEKYGDKLSTYKYTFTKDNGNYVLSDFRKI